MKKSCFWITLILMLSAFLLVVSAEADPVFTITCSVNGRVVEPRSTIKVGDTVTVDWSVADPSSQYLITSFCEAAYGTNMCGGITSENQPDLEPVKDGIASGTFTVTPTFATDLGIFLYASLPGEEYYTGYSSSCFFSVAGCTADPISVTFSGYSDSVMASGEADGESVWNTARVHYAIAGGSGDYSEISATWTIDWSKTISEAALTETEGDLEVTVPKGASGILSLLLAVKDEEYPISEYKDLQIPITAFVPQPTLEYRFSGKTAVVTSPINKNASALTIPATVEANGKTYKVTEIADKAFYGMKKLTKVTIGKYVQEIGEKAFANCPKLKTVKGGNGITEIDDAAFKGDKLLSAFPTLTKLTEIGDEAFSKCVKLAKITLGARVASIGEKAFYGCSTLKSITLKTAKLTEKRVEAKAFQGIHRKAAFQCPAGKAKAYKTLLLKKGASRTCTFQ